MSDYPDWDEETDDDTDDEDDETYSDDVEEEDEEAIFAEIEQVFRRERARIRACDDIHELQALRAEYRSTAESGAREAGRIRARDLIELVDGRITDIKARRLAGRRW
ncbi:MAG: hypothetical protein ABIO70_21340 [Pseudomonadota bacterium]